MSGQVQIYSIILKKPSQIDKICIFRIGKDAAMALFMIDICKIKNMYYLCINKSRLLPVRLVYRAGHFLLMGVRYTHQTITTEQQIDILKKGICLSMMLNKL